VATGAQPGTPGRDRARLISLAGVVIILLSAGALLLPAADQLQGARVIGELLVAAGLIEVLAGLLRRDTRPFAIAAGCVSLIAGLFLVLNPTNHFFPSVVLVIAWLLARSLILAVASRRAGGSVRTWTIISAGMDFVLALLLATGLSVATIVISLFGPTQPLVASFAWVLAASFIVNGLMILEVASCERAAA
jgi:uncharacterized membrane protein HdeD (DUF308 family)